MAAKWQQWYKHDINAWQGSADVQALSDAAYRAFHQLLQAQFQSEDGMLPADDRRLAKLSRKADVWEQIREEVMELFVAGPEGRVYNPRQYKEWLDAQEHGAKMAARASSGGHAKHKSALSRLEADRKQASSMQQADLEHASSLHVTERYVTERYEEPLLAPRSDERTAAAPPNEPELAIGALPCLGPKQHWPFTQGDVDGWSEAYPALDVLGELRRAREWLKANPKNRKTFQGMARFVCTWLGRAQNEAPRRAAEGDTHGDARKSPARARVESNQSALRAAAAARGWGAPDGAVGADRSGEPEPGSRSGDADVPAAIRTADGHARASPGAPSAARVGFASGWEMVSAPE